VMGTKVDLVIQKDCPHCDQKSDFAVSVVINDMVRKDVNCPCCGQVFELSVSLELDTWSDWKREPIPYDAVALAPF
jgi:transcription elongation factor Elf1